jgi:hypothetical protein
MFINIGWIFLYKRFFYKVNKQVIDGVAYILSAYKFRLYNV